MASNETTIATFMINKVGGGGGGGGKIVFSVRLSNIIIDKHRRFWADKF